MMDEENALRTETSKKALDRNMMIYMWITRLSQYIICKKVNKLAYQELSTRVERIVDW